MDFGSKLEEMNLTSDEMSRLCKAFKDETFRKLLQDYAEEISNPENKERYEEEIKQLELGRGMDVQFIHPKPFRVLKTSDGKQKCYINICSNELIRTAECKAGSGENGSKGLHWSVPYSLTPGRPDVDSNGKKHVIYDVVFHPDTLHLASKNVRFMELVDSTAIDGIQKSFKVKLDRKNTKPLKTNYKGVPHAAVIRRPTPGQPRKETTDKNDPLAFPYPYDKVDTSSISNNVTSNLPCGQSTQTKPTKVKQTSEKLPTEPHYTIKYRSIVDIQDFRCSREFVSSPRPREIVITIDLPLLKSAVDADLDVSEKQVIFKSSKPAYRLELDLTYPVDENKGQAKFNKQKRQLVVTLPVRPVKVPPPTAESPVLVTVGGTEEKALNGPNTEEEREKPTTAEDSPQTHTLTTDPKLSCLDVQSIDSATVSDCTGLPEPRLNEEEKHTSFLSAQEDTPLQPDLTRAESFTDNTEESVRKPSTKSEEVDTFLVSVASSLITDTLEKIPNSVRAEAETQNTMESTMEDGEQEASGSQVDTKSAALQQLSDMDNSQTFYHMNDNISQDKVQSTYEDIPEPLGCVSDISGDCERNKTTPRARARKTVQFSGRLSVAQEVIEDGLPEVQSCGNLRSKQPSVVLREVNPEDGSEVVISKHTTSSAFVFQNSLLYDLD